MRRFSDLVIWTFELDCPACGETFEGEARVYPKDSGVSLSCPEYESHIDFECATFMDKYRELMEYD